jgi:putative Ca2+/H+ antiporter (TMEM165/GDT1 family)
MTLSLLFATFCAVFVAELIGDKTLFTIGLLAVRYKPLPMFGGFCVAFSIKTLAAVLLGGMIAALPRILVAGLGAMTFFAMSLAIWLKPAEARVESQARLDCWPHAVAAAFAAIFFTEWGDLGQITAAALTATYHQPFTVWLGATLAMVTKGSLAMMVGASLKTRIPQKAFRYAAVSICLTFGALAAFRII